ncbi:MAG: diaminopimelate epimerase [Syntrophales bacterium]|jgi:diaminopimelate epimerase|nr:diaminopimelate epimerase [Syntrophales bacterium]
MISFYKMSGSGNDFILIDNREGSLPVGDLSAFAAKICARKVSVGADGLIVLERSDRADFRWQFFNADGSVAEMCGNGGRCAARYAFLKGIAPARMTFETLAGIIDAEVKADTVKLRLTDPGEATIGEKIDVNGRTLEIDSIDTGVPHAVHFVKDFGEIDIFGDGRAIRRHAHFQPAGTNVNFVRTVDRHALQVRTYERGVEDETLACGTGSVASALVASARNLVESPVAVTVQSGEVLTIFFEKTKKGFAGIYLEGKTKVVYEGNLWEEAYR